MIGRPSGPLTNWMNASPSSARALRRTTAAAWVTGAWRAASITTQSTSATFTTDRATTPAPTAPVRGDWRACRMVPPQTSTARTALADLVCEVSRRPEPERDAHARRLLEARRKLPEGEREVGRGEDGERGRLGGDGRAGPEGEPREGHGRGERAPHHAPILDHRRGPRRPPPSHPRSIARAKARARSAVSATLP